MWNLIHTREMSRDWIERELFPLSNQFRQGDDFGESLKGRTLYCLFYEPSLLTRTSFERAIGLLGGREYHTEDASQFFPVRTPTYIENTVQLLASLEFDVIVLRSGETGIVERAAAAEVVPIINGGSADDHPTQALLDIYTLQRELGKVDGITIGVVGRLEHRNVNALLTGLSLFQEVEVVLIPISGQANQEVLNYCQARNMRLRQETELAALEEVDAVYLNTPHTTAHAELLKARNLLNMKIDHQFMARLKEHCIVLDPMQRTGNFIVESQDERLAYYRQAQNGLYIRMALLTQILNN